jgi:hypothetical protein
VATTHGKCDSVRQACVAFAKLEFSKWVHVFYNEQMTSDTLDRVLYHCHLLLFPAQFMKGNKYEQTSHHNHEGV